MKKLLIGSLAILLSALGLKKLADNLDTAIKRDAIEAERLVAANGGVGGGGGGGSLSKEGKGKS